MAKNINKEIYIMFEKIKDWVLGIALDQVFPALIIAVLGILIIRIIMVIVKKALEKSKLEKAAHSLIKSLTRVVLWILLALIVASALGVDVTGVVALASVLTLAVSLALQNALANVIGGFTLLYTHPFSSGDYVEIAGQAGTVEEIGLAYTKLATPDNKMISIPNSSVVAAQIVNYTVTGTRRVDVAVSASYDAPVQKVIDALLQAATVDNVLLEPAPFAAVTRYGESAIEYVVRVWTKTEDYWDVNFTIQQNVKTVFDAQGIAMTYPHLNVHIDQ